MGLFFYKYLSAYHVYPPMSIYLCQQTYLHLLYNIYKPTVIYLPIPKYQFIIAEDPGSCIGLV